MKKIHVLKITCLKKCRESSHTNNRNQEVRSRLILFIYNRNNQFENVAEKTISLYCSTKFYKLARAKSDQVMY